MIHALWQNNATRRSAKPAASLETDLKATVTRATKPHGGLMQFRSFLRYARFLILAAVLALTATLALAAEEPAVETPAPAVPDVLLAPPGKAAPEPAAAPAGMDWTEASAFLDGLVESQLVVRNIPGACLAVVKDGKIVALKGYGYANLEKKLRVDPAKTLFRPGSISKLLVWTALMQLSEAGKLELAADVNRYLKNFQINAAFSKPVTAADLLIHTPGFEERSIGIEAGSTKDLIPLGQLLAEIQPNRVYVPGTTPAYSNYGAGLAGYLVESISGLPYEQYLDENIFKPLNMTRSTFRQPIPEAWAPDMATGYTNNNGIFKAQDFELINVSPAGSLSATAQDMAAFMIAQLQNGRYNDKRILKEETAAAMHSRHFSLDERLSSAAYGFYEWLAQGRRLVLHEGSTSYFHSLLALYPDKNLGLYLSFNSPGGEAAHREIVLAFLDRYFPATTRVEPALAPDVSTAAPSDLDGWYLSSRVSYSTIDALTRLFQQRRVVAQKDGTLSVGSFLGNCSIWEPIGPRLYRHKDHKEILAFYPRDGLVTGLALNSSPSVVLLKLERRIETQPVQFGLLGLCILILLTAYLSWPLVYWARRGENPVRPYVPALPGWLAVATGFLFAVFFALYFLVLLPSLSNGFTWYLRIILALPYLALALGLCMAGLWALMWFGETFGRKPKRWGLYGHIHYLVVLAACAGLLWFLKYWKLLWLPF